MQISIITVCFNSVRTIEHTIRSILSQTNSDFESIVIDGLSTDGTVEMIKSYRERVVRFVSEPDSGIYDAMNKGIALAEGDVIGILNSDDFYPDCHVLESVNSFFETHPNVDMMFGDIVFVSPENLDKVTRHFSSKFFVPWMLRFGWMPPHTGTFIRRSVYEKFGLYKLNYKTAADYEMFVRLLLVNNVSYKRVDRVFVKMRSGGATTSGIRSNLNTSHEILRSLRENSIYSNLFLLTLRLPIKYFLEKILHKLLFKGAKGRDL